MTTNLNPTFLALATSMLGRSVVQAEGDVLRIAALSDKIGTMKDSSKGSYVLLKRGDDEAIVLELHPETAKRLFKNGAEKDLKMVAAEVMSESTPTEAEQAELKAELAGVQVEPLTLVSVADPKPEVKADEPKKPSKKDQFVALYKQMIVAEGKARKDVKVEAAKIGVESEAGFNTYFQNCKSGKWA